MKRKLMTMVLTVIMLMAMSITAFAGQWKEYSGAVWRWLRDDDSWPANKWEWIDGDGDGIAERFYLDESGFRLSNTTTPDGYTVNGNGEWTVNGEVQHMDLTAARADFDASTEKVNSLPIAAGQILDMKCMIPYSPEYSGETSTEIFLSGDGTFSGKHIELCFKTAYQGTAFDGVFSDIRKIDDYSYYMTLEKLNVYELEDPVDPYIFTGHTDGIRKSGHYIFYLPGADLTGLPDQSKQYLSASQLQELTATGSLSAYVLLDVDDQYCFVSK